ncbi:hypothetical protein D9M73_162320 [compost metagenome]
MEVDFGIALHHRHRFGPRRAHRHQFGTDRGGDAKHQRMRACAADHHARPGGGGRQRREGIVRGEDTTGGGERNRARHGHAIDREANMHRPIRAPLAKFARAVERIDDPHAPRAAPCGVILRFFRKDEIVGTRAMEQVQDQRIGLGVPAIAKLVIGTRTGLAKLDQQRAGGKRDVAGELGVGLWAQRSGLHTPIICSTIRSAAASGLSRSVSMRMSGLSGAS